MLDFLPVPLDPAEPGALTTAEIEIARSYAAAEKAAGDRDRGALPFLAAGIDAFLILGLGPGGGGFQQIEQALSALLPPFCASAQRRCAFRGSWPLRSMPMVI
jgi:hypothetical protein